MELVENKKRVSSKDIAIFLGKRHSNITQKIETMLQKDANMSSEVMFDVNRVYLPNGGFRLVGLYWLSEKALVKLATSFTGTVGVDLRNHFSNVFCATVEAKKVDEDTIAKLNDRLNKAAELFKVMHSQIESLQESHDSLLQRLMRVEHKPAIEERRKNTLAQIAKQVKMPLKNAKALIEWTKIPAKYAEEKEDCYGKYTEFVGEGVKWIKRVLRENRHIEPTLFDQEEKDAQQQLAEANKKLEAAQEYITDYIETRKAARRERSAFEEMKPDTRNHGKRNRSRI